MTPAPPPLVIGGGLLGSAIARQLHAARTTPLVCSRTPRAHPGLWCSIRDLSLQRQQQVWIAVGPGPQESGGAVWGRFLPDLLSRLLDAQADVLCCGPLPAALPCDDLAAFDEATRKFPVPVLRLPLLFGNDSPARAALTALRAGETVWIDRDLPPFRPLWVEDAARAALLRHTGELQGPDTFAADDLLDLLAAGTPGRWRRRLWPLPSPAARRARAQRAVEAPWPDALPAPLPFKNWLGRLPEKPSGR